MATLNELYESGAKRVRKSGWNAGQFVELREETPLCFDDPDTSIYGVYFLNHEEQEPIGNILSINDSDWEEET